MCILGVKQIKEDKYIEALVTLQEASTQPSPRVLLAHAHMLTGLCYAKLVRSSCTAKSQQIYLLSSLIIRGFFFYTIINIYKKKLQIPQKKCYLVFGYTNGRSYI